MTKLNKNEGENTCIFFMRMIMRMKMILFTIYFLKSRIYQNSKKKYNRNVCISIEDLNPLDRF